MKLVPTQLPEVLLLEPRVFGDSRGFLFESWNEREFERAGIQGRFVQDNHSRSEKGVLRGLHYQLRQPQGKLIRVVAGEVFDVAVDVRRSSATFGKWEGIRLSAESHRMLWIPVGFAHGFCVLSDFAEVLYKATDFYSQVSANIFEAASGSIDIFFIGNDFGSQTGPLLGIERARAEQRINNIVIERDHAALFQRHIAQADQRVALSSRGQDRDELARTVD